MILSGAILLCLLGAWLAIAAFEGFRLGIGFRQALLYVPFKLVVPDQGQGDPRRERRQGARHLRGLAPVANRSGADAVAAARTDAAYPRRGVGEIDVARTMARACPHHHLQRPACLRQPAAGARAERQRTPRRLFSRQRRTRHQILPAVSRGRAHRHAGRRQDHPGFRRRRAPPALLADAGGTGAAPLAAAPVDHRT